MSFPRTCPVSSTAALSRQWTQSGIERRERRCGRSRSLAAGPAGGRQGFSGQLRSPEGVDSESGLMQLRQKATGSGLPLQLNAHFPVAVGAGEVGGVLLLLFLVQFTYHHKIHPFRIYNSAVFSIFTRLLIHHHDLSRSSPKNFHYPPKESAGP